MAKVLIVDDKESNLLALENVLKCLDVRIIKALSGEEALRATLNHDFALVILDVQMPTMDGYELASLLRNDTLTRNVPIIFLSAVYSDEPNVFRGYEAGGVEFITKPFNPDILLSKVRVFLALHEQKVELLNHKTRLEAMVSQLDEQIQARWRAEESLRQTNESLEQKVSARTADMAKMVHELKIANEQLAARADQLRALAGELTMAEHRERERLARILHDGLQQHLAIAKLQVGSICEQKDREDLKQKAAEVEKIIGEAIAMSRSLSADLSPPVLHSGGLEGGLEWLSRWMREKHGFGVDLTLEGGLELPEEVIVLVFESVRELLFNAVKHAKVSRARVRLQAMNGAGLRVTVSDNGAGFVVDDLKPAGSQGAGFGLFSIRERIDSIGGSFRIESVPANGSRFILTVPHRTSPAK
jgi:signal transduction histidine kinase